MAAVLLLSDCRLKTRVARCATSRTGLPIYRFAYVWDPATLYEGVMAQVRTAGLSGPGLTLARPGGCGGRRRLAATARGVGSGWSSHPSTLTRHRRCRHQSTLTAHVDSDDLLARNDAASHAVQRLPGKRPATALRYARAFFPGLAGKGDAMLVRSLVRVH
eukprot:1769811-Rhodomonas_salina.2